MPISRSKRTYYTKEEYEAAKRNDNALLYAQRQGYDLVRTGRYFYLRQHDSLVFAPSGAWFWNSRGLSGRALEFIVFFEGRSFPEAVLILAGTVQPGFTPRVIPRSIPPPVKQPQPIPFALPKPANNDRQLFAYLCGRRKLDEAIVREMLEQKVLYESVSPNHIHNACFVSQDETGKPCSAFLRGMGKNPSREKYREEVKTTGGCFTESSRIPCWFLKLPLTQLPTLPYCFTKELTPFRAEITWHWEGCALTPSPTTYPPILTSGRLTSFWTGTAGGGPPPHGLIWIYRRKDFTSPPNFPLWERTGTIPSSLPAAPNRFKQIRFCDRVCFFHIPFSQEADMFRFFNSVSLTLFQQVNTAFRKTGVNPVVLTTINANMNLDMYGIMILAHALPQT